MFTNEQMKRLLKAERLFSDDCDYSDELIPGYTLTNNLQSISGAVNAQKSHVQFDGPIDYFAQRLFNTRMTV